MTCTNQESNLPTIRLSDLKPLRQSLGLTQVEAAKIIGMSSGNVSRIERGCPRITFPSGVFKRGIKTLQAMRRPEWVVSDRKGRVLERAT